MITNETDYKIALQTLKMFQETLKEANEKGGNVEEIQKEIKAQEKNILLYELRREYMETEFADLKNFTIDYIPSPTTPVPQGKINAGGFLIDEPLYKNLFLINIEDIEETDVVNVSINLASKELKVCFRDTPKLDVVKLSKKVGKRIDRVILTPLDKAQEPVRKLAFCNCEVKEILDGGYDYSDARPHQFEITVKYKNIRNA